MFKASSVEDLAGNIYKISKKEKSEIEKIGLMGRKNVCENFTKTKMCRKTLEIYESLVY